MSWESSALYYRLINEETQRRLGGHHNARSLMATVDFDEVERLQHAGDWDRLAVLMAEAAIRLERGGADFVVLCTNTMHKLAGAIESAVTIPLLHIADAAGAALQAEGHSQVGLLATRFTMEGDFYRDRLRTRFGIESVIPGDADRAEVHRVIYEELCHGRILDDSRGRYQAVIGRLAQAGASAVILGCTEIELLIAQGDSELPVFPTTRLHAMAAVELALR